MKKFKLFSIFIMLLFILFMPFVQDFNIQVEQPVFSVDHQAVMECPLDVSKLQMVNMITEEKENLNAILVNTEMIDQNTQANLDTENEISVAISEARADYLIRFS